MANKPEKSSTQLEQIEATVSKTEQYIENNRRSLLIIVIIIIGLVGLYLGFQNFYLEPLEEEAHNDMFMAEMYFEKDSFQLALNGDGQYLGFVDIADEYGLTKAGNLANYYAGICFLHTKKFEEAIEYLNNFSSSDIILSTLALGGIGDAYLELKNNESALKYYKEAAENHKNDFLTPRYLMKQAFVLELDQQYPEAEAIYTQIKQDFSKSREALEIDKYIARAKNRK